MKNRYSFTGHALHNLTVYGVAPGEVWEALHAKRRITRHLTGEAAAVFGITNRGRHLVVLVAESGLDDNDWDIVAARDMDTAEVTLFEQHTRRKP